MTVVLLLLSVAQTTAGSWSPPADCAKADTTCAAWSASASPPWAMKTDDITAHDDAVVTSFRLYDDDADQAISRDEYQVFLQSIKVRNYQGIQGNMQNGFDAAERWADALKKLGETISKSVNQSV